MKNKIDEYELGPKVLTLRKTLTCEEVADVVNKQYLPAGVEPINKMTVSRYCSAHGMTDMERNDISKGVTYFDALSEACKVRDRVVRHENRLVRVYENLKEDEEKLSELASISNALLNTYRMHQDLNERVSKLQKEQLGVDKVRKALRILVETLNKYPEVKADYFQRLRDAEEYEIIQSI